MTARQILLLAIVFCAALALSILTENPGAIVGVAVGVAVVAAITRRRKTARSD